MCSPASESDRELGTTSTVRLCDLALVQSVLTRHIHFYTYDIAICRKVASYDALISRFGRSLRILCRPLNVDSLKIQRDLQSLAQDEVRLGLN